MLKTAPAGVMECIERRGLPAAKIGEGWVLVDDDVIAWVRAQYPANGRAPEPSQLGRKLPLGIGGAPRNSIGTAEIAEMLGVTREHVTNKVVTRTDFPAPVMRLSQKRRLWSLDQVMAYLADGNRRRRQ